MPARELFGDLLLELGRPAEALKEYEASLQTSPNRLKGLYGAGRAAELAGDKKKAREFYVKLVAVCEMADSRPGRACSRKEVSWRSNSTSIVMPMFEMRAIGFVSSPYAETAQIPKGCGAKHEAEGVLDVLPEFEEGLTDIEGFSHLFRDLGLS